MSNSSLKVTVKIFALIFSWLINTGYFEIHIQLIYLTCCWERTAWSGHLIDYELLRASGMTTAWDLVIRYSIFTSHTHTPTHLAGHLTAARPHMCLCVAARGPSPPTSCKMPWPLGPNPGCNSGLNEYHIAPVSAGALTLLTDAKQRNQPPLMHTASQLFKFLNHRLPHH